MDAIFRNNKTNKSTSFYTKKHIYGDLDEYLNDDIEETQLSDDQHEYPTI